MPLYCVTSACPTVAYSSNIAKPILDVILYNFQLSRNVGAEGLIATSVLVQGSAALRASLLPPSSAAWSTDSAQYAT